MHPDRNEHRDGELLSEPLVERVLARASEIDATRASHVPVGDVRAAAMEAGISNQAFEAALAEVRAPGAPPIPVAALSPRETWLRTGLFGAAILLVLGVGTFATTKRAPAPAELPPSTAPSWTSAPAAPFITKAYALRCLSGAQAAELVRPILKLRANEVVVSEAEPTMIRIHANARQWSEIRALLAPYEGPDAPSCANRPRR